MHLNIAAQRESWESSRHVKQSIDGFNKVDAFEFVGVLQ